MGLAAHGQRAVSGEGFRADVDAMHQLVAACASNANACDAKAVRADEIVNGTTIFTMHWDWLSAALHKAHDAKPEERAQLMQAADARLDAVIAEATESRRDDAGFDAARRDANSILAGPEFQGNPEQPNWFQRVLNWIGALIASIFSGVAKAASATPWMGPLLEWGLFLAAAALLFFFVMRSFSRQRLRVALNESNAGALHGWSRESEDWARLAEASAANGDWREAVHGLYWAAIVRLESRRAWRHNPSRTPREYVRLLKAGSAQQKALRGLTQIFERVWYGFEDADSEEYGHARTLFEGLSTTEAGAAAPAERA